MAGAMRKDNMKTGGGWLNDITAPVISARWGLCKYGSMKDAAPMLILKYDLALEKPWEETLSLGLHADDCTISKDGKIITMKTGKGINAESKGGLWLTSLQECKDPEFPPDMLDDDASVLDGIKVHLIQEKPPEFYSDKSKTVTVVSRIIELPPAAQKASTKAASGKGQTKKDTASADIKAQAVGAMRAVLAANNGTIEQNNIVPALFQIMGQDPNIGPISQMIYNPDFLASGPWNFDAESGVITAK